MSTSREAEILEELNGFKWFDEFICLKCGNKSYIKGEEPFSRRCGNSKCKKEISLKKYTAFEGLRFPIEKAYGILEAIIDGADLDNNKKVYPVSKRKNKEGEALSPDLLDLNSIEDKEVRYLSMYEVMERSEKNNWAPGKIDLVLQKMIDDNKPTIASLSRDFGVEENTIKKFIVGIDNRLVPNNKMELKDPLQRLLRYIADNRGVYQLSYILGMAMVPLVGKWELGRFRIDNTNYSIRPIPKYKNGPWSVYRTVITLREDEYEYDYREELRYGSDEWFELFRTVADK